MRLIATRCGKSLKISKLRKDSVNSGRQRSDAVSGCIVVGSDELLYRRSGFLETILGFFLCNLNSLFDCL